MSTAAVSPTGRDSSNDGEIPNDDEIPIEIQILKQLEASPEEKQSVCECLEATDIPTVVEDCQSEVDDRCVKCFQEQQPEPICEPSGFTDVLRRVAACPTCSGLLGVETAETADDCRAALESIDAVTERNECLCRECPGDFGACLGDFGCLAIASCCDEADLDPFECVGTPTEPGPCREIFQQVGEANPLGGQRATDLGLCSAQTKCNE
ncbi:MAG: hypothetical protein JXM73_18880 [Anaerolineae bacterium]|nr:hypothetical protein [Anaerolineae bacterium]